MKKTVEADELAGFVEADQVAHPDEQGNISDAIVGVHHPDAAREPFVEETEQPRGLRCGAVTTELVLIRLSGDFVVEAELTAQRPHPARYEEHTNELQSI